MASRAQPCSPEGSSRCGRVVSSLDLSPESSDRLDLAAGRAEERVSFVLFSEQEGMIEALRRECAFAKVFVAYLLARNIRFEQRLWGQLFHPARTNWLASACEKEGGCKPSIAKENPGDAG